MKRSLVVVTVPLVLGLLAAPVAADYMTVLDILQKRYGMEGIQLSPGEMKMFRDKTRLVRTKWIEEIGADLVRDADTIVESAK
jgi:hypothetical protein